VKLPSYERERRERGRALFNWLRSKGVLLREPTDEQLAFFGDRMIFADIQPGQDLEWIRSAVYYTERVVDGSARPAETALFWIRVTGVFSDIADTYRTSLSASNRMSSGTSVSEVHAQLQTLVDAIASAVSVLPEDEVHYLEYRRNLECHPRQSKYRAQLGKDGNLRNRGSTILPGVLTQADSEDTLRTVNLRYGTKEHVAAAIARKLLEPLRKIETAARPLCEPSP